MVGLAGQTLLARHTSRAGTSDPLLQLFFSHLLGGLILMAGKTATVGWKDLAALSPEVFVLLQYPAVFPALMGFGLLFAALRYLSAPFVSLLCTTEIVFAMALTTLILHQPPTGAELLGSSLVLAAVALPLGLGPILRVSPPELELPDDPPRP